MRMTTTTRYGLRALFDIAYHGSGLSVHMKDISRRQQIPERYLEQILHNLMKGGLLQSRRGPRGGYRLSRDPSRITVRHIVEASAESIVPLSCLAGEEECKADCELFGECVMRNVWDESRKRILDYFESITLADLCALGGKEGLTQELPHDYIYVI